MLKTAFEMRNSAWSSDVCSSDLLANSLKVSRDNQLPAYEVVQPEFNLYKRDSYEGKLQDLCLAEDIGAVTYYGLASGFLTGKYRSQADLGQSVRGGGIGKYLNPRGEAVLAALDKVAEAHAAAPAEVALAWLIAQPGVAAPIASATRVAQVETFSNAVSLKLTDQEMATLAVE